MIEDELTRTRLQKDSALRDKTSIEAKLTRELEEWRVRAEELADYSEEQVSKYGVREERRRADGREERLRAWDVIVEQERIAERWKRELESTVTAYEAQVKKLKKDNRLLKQGITELQARLEYPCYHSAESTQC